MSSLQILVNIVVIIKAYVQQFEICPRLLPPWLSSPKTQNNITVVEYNFPRTFTESKMIFLPDTVTQKHVLKTQWWKQVPVRYQQLFRKLAKIKRNKRGDRGIIWRMQQGGVSYSGTVPDKGRGRSSKRGDSGCLCCDKVTHRRMSLSRTVPNIPSSPIPNFLFPFYVSK